MADPLTAAELKQIGERVREPNSYNDSEWIVAKDRARLFAALERLIDRGLEMYGDQWLDIVDGVHYPTKDAAIDALLQGGWE